MILMKIGKESQVLAHLDFRLYMYLHCWARIHSFLKQDMETNSTFLKKIPQLWRAQYFAWKRIRMPTSLLSPRNVLLFMSPTWNEHPHRGIDDETQRISFSIFLWFLPTKFVVKPQNKNIKLKIQLRLGLYTSALYPERISGAGFEITYRWLTKSKCCGQWS